MYVVLVVLISFIILIIILLSICSLKVIFSIDSEELTNFNLRLSWLKPLIKGIVKREEKKLTFTAYFLNKKIMTKNLVSNKSSNTNNFKLIKSIKFNNLNLKTSYGFEDPSITGMVCGAINVISDYVGINNSNVNPDFSADYDHFNVYVVAEVNVIVSLLNIIRLKKSSLTMQKLHVSK